MHLDANTYPATYSDPSTTGSNTGVYIAGAVALAAIAGAVTCSILNARSRLQVAEIENERAKKAMEATREALSALGELGPDGKVTVA